MPSSRLLPGLPLPLYSPWLSLRLSAGDHQVYLSTVTYTPHQIPSLSSIHIFTMVASEMQNAIQHIQVCWTSISTWKNDSLEQQHFFWFQYVIWFIVANVMIELSLPSTLPQVCWPDGHNLKTPMWDLDILGWHPPWSSFLICTIRVSKLRTSCTKHENYLKIWSCHGMTLGTWRPTKRR